MCTVTLVPYPGSPEGFILTSNRDEAVSRETLAPGTDIYHSRKLFYPKDKQAGGTWIGVSDRQRCICLINGANKPHVREPYYRKSRGVVVKDFLASEKIWKTANEYDLENIEPFTMIGVEWRNGLLFFELIWNDEKRKLSKLPLREHIWSSSPLYTEEMKKLRNKWFKELKNSDGLSARNILDFHHAAGDGDKTTNLIIDRGFLKTQSITQVYNSEDGLSFHYENLLDGQISFKDFS